MSRPIYRRPVRQHVIELAAMTLQAWHDTNQPTNQRNAIDAIDAVVSDNRFGKLGISMRRYVYQTYGWNFYELAFEVERQAQR